MQKTDFPFEIIIGEDESSDGTREICQYYANKYSSIVRLCLRSRKDVIYIDGNPTGRYNFVNTIQEAKGKYIAYIDGDDYWTDPHKLQKQVTILESHPEFVGSFHETQQVNEDGSFGKIFGHDAPQILTTEDTIATVSPFHSSSIVFNKEAFFVPDWFYNVVSGDMAFFSIISKKGNFIKIPEIMSCYNKHKGGLTNTSQVKDNFHADRIILINYLNSFHDFKYNEKSKKVINYHRNQLHDSQISLTSPQNTHHATSHSLLNNEFEKEQRVHTPPTMLSDSEIKLLYWLSKDIFTGSGNLVELGSWLGGSTAAFAQGLLKNKKITSKKIFSYDNFIWTKWYERYNLDISKSIGDSFLDIYLQNINQWKEIVDVRHGDVCEIGWHGDPIELLFIDIMKSLDTAKCVARCFFPSLIPGKSLVVHQDFKHFHEFWIHMMMFRLREHLVPVLNIVDAPTLVFKCIKTLSSSTIAHSCTFDTFTKNEINDAFKFSLDIANGSNINFIDEINNAHNKALEYFATVNTNSTKNSKISSVHPSNIYDHFVNPNISADFCDLYIVRKSIKESLTRSLPLFNGTLLDVGCGQMPYREYILNTNPNIKKYIGLDFAQGKYADLKQPDITWDGKTIPLEDASVDCAMATEVLEHCFAPSIVLQEIKRVLKPGGVFFFTTPFLWPIHDAPHDHYRYTPCALGRLLAEAGFNDICIKALGGWNAALAQMIGLWLRRAPMAGGARAQLTKDLYPFFTELVRTDVVPRDFSKNPMITGLSGTAKSAGRRAEKIPNRVGQRVIVVTDQFPVLSQTFILDQMTGLMDRGLAVEHWSMERMDQSVVHENVRKYALLESTRFITLPPDALRTDPKRWAQQFLSANNLSDLDDVASVQIHFGPNFNKIAPLFAAYPELFVLVSFHGYDGSATFKVKGADVYKGLFVRANRITTPSKYMKDTLIQHGCPPDKIVVHHYGKDIVAFAPTPRKGGSRPVRLVSVARLVEKKGLEYSISAFAKAQAGLNVEYRIIGYGPLEPKLIELAKTLGVKGKVRFLGQLTNDAVRQEMANADIFVLTSVTAKNGDQEGVPVSLIEAQALGLPVVSSVHAGIPELVEHGKTGFLAEEKNVEQISAFMRILIKNSPIRKEFSVNARNKVLHEFDLAKLNDKLSDILTGKGQEDATPWNLGKNVAQTDTRGETPHEKERDKAAAGEAYCPVCRSRHASFRPFGKPERLNALCPDCNSLERHRALWLFLERYTDFLVLRR